MKMLNVIMDNHLLNYLLLITTSLTILASKQTDVEICGGHLMSRRGIIQTPNFPGPFTVPIKCRWVIDASDIAFGNSSIVIYLTQLYVYKGLKFTEYAYYESETSNFGPTIIKEISEINVFQYRWFKTYRPFLVIDFKLERLEGNHVRVLNDLLDVYGFNVTYEVTEVDAKQNSCTVRDCSFAGNCILDGTYGSFQCHCFEGFRGDRCSYGPLCMDDNRDATCRNSGTCKHIGAAAVRCQCTPGFTGNSCEIPLMNDTHGACRDPEGCIEQCTFVGASAGDRKPCSCKNPIRVKSNRARYECRLKLANSSAIRSGANAGSTEALLQKQLGKYLRNSNISTVADLKILNVTPSAEVTFHFFGISRDGDKIRESLNRLVQLRRLNDFALESTHFTFQQKPSLRLQSLRVNHVNEYEVRLGDQFILSCVAQGSDEIKFVWYKDGVLVNTSKATREIWYRDLPDDGSDTHTSLLTIDKATLLDAGQYTCQTIDWELEQCKTIYIDVRDEPDVKILPMSATIEKGNDLQLLCITPNMHSLGIGFGWTKNRALLKLEPGSQVWEDLYPAGSILKIINAQKSAIYTCNVAQRSMSVRVEVVNRTLIPICLGEYAWNLHFPETGPNSEALLDCPQKFVGNKVTRFCSMKDATTSIWQLPDFSDCLYKPLLIPYKKFRSLTLGYQNTTGPETIIELWKILDKRKLLLYPGEGDRLLSILAEIENYQNTINDIDDLYNSAETLIKIINRILDDDNSTISHSKQLLLQQLTLRNLEYWTRLLIYPYKHLALSSIVVDIRALHTTEDNFNEYVLQVPVDDHTYPEWYGDRVTISLLRSDADANYNRSYSGIVIVYKNITKFLPKTHIKGLDDGSDLEYRFQSRLITVALSPQINQRSDTKIQIQLKMRHLTNTTGAWNISCGIEDQSGGWDLDSCSPLLIKNEGSTICTCTRTGTIALFLTSHAPRLPQQLNDQTEFIVLLGCELCLLQSTISSLILGIYLWKNRTWLNFLKLQCATALLGAMGVFIYAVQSSLSENSYASIAVTLEALLLIGMSSPISQALIIYADLTQIRPSKHFQPTVIAVITGLPIICILTTELTHMSTGLRHESWWLIFGTDVYNIFISCLATMLSIFLLLYTGVLWKSHNMMKKKIVKKETIGRKIGLLHRAAIIVCGLIIMEAASILYVNSPSPVYDYFFAIIDVVLGFIILFAYIGCGEILLFVPILRKLRFKEEAEIISDTIKVSPQTTDLDNETAPPPPPPSLSTTATILNGRGCRETRGIAAGSIDMRDYVNETPGKSSRCNRHNDDINLENYSTSPRKYNETRRYDKLNKNQYCQQQQQKADFYKTYEPTMRPVNCRDSQTSTISLEPMAPIGETSTTTVLCSVEIEPIINLSGMPDVTLATKGEPEMSNNIEVNTRDIINVIPDIASTTGRKQPEGEEDKCKDDDDDCETTTIGMLDRISHDLDYLLNRTGEEA